MMIFIKKIEMIRIKVKFVSKLSDQFDKTSNILQLIRKFKGKRKKKNKISGSSNGLNVTNQDSISGKSNGEDTINEINNEKSI